MGLTACPNTANWSQAHIINSEKSVETTLSTETDQAIVSQEANVRFEDTARVETQAGLLPLEKLWRIVNPYPEDTPTTLLQRVVQIPDYAWNGAWTGAEIKLLTSILTVSNIHSSILGSFQENMYRFLQCGFRVTVRVNSTPFHQGSLVVTWCPDNYQTVNVPGGILGYASMENAVILSASQQDQCTIDIPYFQLNPHYDLAFPAEWIDMRLNLKVLNPLLTSSSTIVDTVPITVFIQMTDIHTYGILDPDTLAKKTQPPKKGKWVSQGSKARSNTEAQAKDELGETAKGVISVVKPVLRSIPLVSQVLDFGKNLFANLDKPTTDQNLQFITTRAQRGHQWLTGVDNSELLTSFPNCAVSKDLGMNSSDMNVTSYCQVPALFYTSKVTSKGVILKVPVHPNVYSNSTRAIEFPDYLAFASSFYRYYRGSIRYLFQFVGTPFYSARFKISIVHSLAVPIGGTGNGTGFMSRVVDVKGDAWTSFIVPYLGRRMWSYTTTSIDSVPNVPYMIIELLTDVQGSSLPADASYYINVWRAAGPDYQLAMQQSSTASYITATTTTTQTTTTTPSNARGWKPQSALAKKWSEPTEPLKEGSTIYRESNTYMTDQATTITDMFKRYAPHNTNGEPVFVNSFPSDWNNTTLQTRAPIHLFSSSFLFWHGSRRIKSAGKNTFATIATIDTAVDYNRAMFPDVTSTFTNAYTVPWYCPELAYTTTIARHDYNPYEATVPVDLTTFGFSQPMWISAGDDFAYYWLVPPNPNAVLLANTPPPMSGVLVSSFDNTSSHPVQVKDDYPQTVKQPKTPELMS